MKSFLVAILAISAAHAADFNIVSCKLSRNDTLTIDIARESARIGRDELDTESVKKRGNIVTVRIAASPLVSAYSPAKIEIRPPRNLRTGEIVDAVVTTTSFNEISSMSSKECVFSN